MGFREPDKTIHRHKKETEMAFEFVHKLEGQDIAKVAKSILVVISPEGRYKLVIKLREGRRKVKDTYKQGQLPNEFALSEEGIRQFFLTNGLSSVLCNQEFKRKFRETLERATRLPEPATVPQRAFRMQSRGYTR